MQQPSVPSEEGSSTQTFWVTVWALSAAFSTYFCMYAFRRPFTAAEFAGESFLGTAVALKTAFIISQLLGYTLSKVIGIRVCSEMPRRAAVSASWFSSAVRRERCCSSPFSPRRSNFWPSF